LAIFDWSLIPYQYGYAQLLPYQQHCDFRLTRGPQGLISTGLSIETVSALSSDTCTAASWKGVKDERSEFIADPDCC
jgi:hypothetical protein